MTHKAITFLSIFAIIALTMLMHGAGWLFWLENPAHRFLDAIAGGIYGGITIKSSTSVASVTAECLDLKVKSAKLEILLEENKELRKQLGFFTSSIFRHVGAEVIGKNVLSDGSVVRINRGSRDGIKIGNPAIVSAGIFIGKVIAVDEFGSTVRLLNDSQSKVAASVINKNHTIGVVEGGYDISARMNLIPQNEVVRINDQIVTSGLEEGVPAGLLIGTIEAVMSETYQPFQYAILTPAVDLNKLTIVSVIIESGQEI